MNKQPPKTAWLAFAVAILAWSSSYTGIRIGLTQYSPGSLALLRYASASITMALIYCRLPHRSGLKWKDVPYLFCLGAIGFAFYNVTLNHGEITVQAAIAGFLISLIPIGMIILSRIFFKEKSTLRALIGISISFIGIVLICIGESKGITFNFGVIYILCSVVAGSIYSTFQKPMLTRYHPIEFAAYTIWGGTLALAIYTPHLYQELPHASLKATLWGVYLGIVPAALGYMSWSYVLRYVPTAKAGSALYIVPIISIFLGWIFINEIPNWLSLTGGLIALVGAIVVNYQKKTKKHTAQSKMS